MPMVCAHCNKVYERQVSCPTCGTRLQFTSVAAAAGAGDWQHTGLGRILIGLLLAQGLALGLRLFCEAGLLAAVEQSATDVAWSTLLGLLTLQGLHALCLLLAGTLTGAGKGNGYALGAVVGLVNGVLLLWLQAAAGQPLTEVAVYGQPILHAAFGAAGGLLGSLIWRPLPVIRLADAPAELRKGPRPRRTRPGLFAGPIAWLRVALGTALVLAGVFTPALMLDAVLRASDGQMQITSQMQASLLTWELAGLAVVAGSAVAGANTFNGLKQGLCVGIAAGSVLFFAQLSDPAFVLERLVLTCLCVAALAVAGGWFGCRLFPPVVAVRRRHSIASAP